MTTTKTLGGVPASIVLRYLREAPGATESTENDGVGSVSGPGWQCTVVKKAPCRHGSLSIGQVEVSVTGSQETVEELFAYLMPLVMRGGA